MYTPHMRRLQISIDEDLDDALGIEAGRLRTSKAALIRQFVRERLGSPSESPDPFGNLIGDIDEVAGEIDGVVYER